jgi:hypothetical protein
MFDKIASPKASKRLPGEFISGELITNTNNSMNIQKNSISFLDVPIGPGEVHSLKKKPKTKNLVELVL